MDRHTGAMDQITTDQLEQAAAAVRAVLLPAVQRDWQVAAGPLEWTCAQTAAHIAHDLTAYAAQLAGGARDRYLPLDLTVRDGTDPAALLEILAACAGLLVAVVRSSAPDTTAWHWGATDATGFLALGMNELLVHAWDITQGLGLDWRPPATLCDTVLRRLVPDAPAGDPVDVLLWVTGRRALDDAHPRQTRWTVQAARPSPT